MGFAVIEPVDDASTSTAPVVALTVELAIFAVVMLVIEFSAWTKPIDAEMIPTLAAKPVASARIWALSVADTVTDVQ